MHGRAKNVVIPAEVAERISECLRVYQDAIQLTRDVAHIPECEFYNDFAAAMDEALNNLKEACAGYNDVADKLFPIDEP